ncbi:MAG TPA: MoxR family ATPase [Gemmata sp.]|jgi:MoxR-like ATPase|nr:MoxR family ATPase [Gemmata sp.]
MSVAPSPDLSVPATPTAPVPESRVAHELAQQAKQLNQKVAAEVARVVVGVEAVTQQLLIALLAGGHVLLEGVPGVAKTTLSKVFARLLGCQYQRVQFTPDLLPSDVTGTSIFDRNTNDFVLRKGPIFTQVLLADEINRAPAKTQAALLEAMQEYQVTVDGNSLPLQLPFMVMATQNPVEQEGVYRLPEAQLDRFLIRVEMGYPGFGHEVNLLRLHSKPAVEVTPMFTPELILSLQRKLPAVYGADTLFEYIVQLAEESRQHPDVALGASPRAALNLLKCARARAVLEGRHFFTHEDVQAIAFSVLGHRLILRPEAEIEGKQVSDIVRDILEAVPVLDTV